ncbi:hypothetical protein IFM51744_09668 [Aspergillus udagawae]|uniref:Uncharacterized protein n=1 Tax=Aspergillus udagawae TaxID=91492 RepID=A0ABQ1B8Z6_9EURO|nr:hypothetical protein IFM51744_09668 [Aspergillus udagawae]GFF96382.1 hypothetical protein IFM53868_08511 [Aspergillus udagawae]
MPPSPMKYGTVMRAVEPRQVLLNTDPQQDTERYPADLPDPEQAQRVTIGRPEAEELLVDTPYILEDTEDQEVGEVHKKPTGEDLCSDPPPGRRFTIIFHAFDRRSWRRTDTDRVCEL